MILPRRSKRKHEKKHRVCRTGATNDRLVAVSLEGLRSLVVDLGILLRLGKLSLGSLLALVVGGTLGLSALLQPVQIQSVNINQRQSSGYSRIGLLSRIATRDHLSRIFTHLSTTSWYFQPTSWLRRPTVQYLRPGCRRRTRRAWGTTIFFCLSYGGGTPSKTLRRSRAAAPRAVLWGIMPRTVL